MVRLAVLISTIYHADREGDRGHHVAFPRSPTPRPPPGTKRGPSKVSPTAARPGPPTHTFITARGTQQPPPGVARTHGKHHLLLFLERTLLLAVPERRFRAATAPQAAAGTFPGANAKLPPDISLSPAQLPIPSLAAQTVCITGAPHTDPTAQNSADCSSLPTCSLPAGPPGRRHLSRAAAACDCPVLYLSR